MRKSTVAKADTRADKAATARAPELMDTREVAAYLRLKERRIYDLVRQRAIPHVRATGTGFAIGVGRGGSVLAPAAAGFLFAAGYGVPAISIVMALGSFVAAGVLLFLKLTPDTRDEQPVEQGASIPANLSRAT